MSHEAVSISLAQSTVEELRQEAARQRRPVSWLVEDALARYLLKIRQEGQDQEEVAG